MKISAIHASEILDSRGNPTTQAVVKLEDGSEGWAAVPSGASTGKYEAVELRDGDKARYNGLGGLKAVENVNTTIQTVLKGQDAADQRNIDSLMIEADGTENKGNLGANAILAVSLATARAEAISEKKPLYAYLSKYNPDHNGTFIMPIPEMNVMNGGKHANWATDIQEYMLFPLGAASVRDGVRMGAEVYAHLKSLLKKKGYAVGVGDEGGYAPAVGSNAEPFELMSEAIKLAGYEAGKDIYLGIDAAASEFYHDGKYVLNKENKTMTGQEFADFLSNMTTMFPIVSMEDVFAEDDWETFKNFTAKHGKNIQIVGDDLYVTNVKRLERGIAEKSSNSILIKLNQIGSLTETIDAILLARQNGMSSIVSHRSGETEDAFIADFVVAMGAGQIKTGAPGRSERTAKYNRLMVIEEELNGNSTYAKFPFEVK